MEEPRKKCTVCGISHRLSFFRKTRKKSMHDGVHTQYRLSVCKECERKERERRKRSDPDFIYRQKACNTLSKHASRMGLTFKQFCAAYDLTVDYIAYLFKKEWLAYSQLGLNCPACRCRHTDEDPLTFEQLTLDRIDRKKGYWQSNIRIVCRTYNTGKGKKDSIEYDRECRDYREHEKAIKKGVQFDLPTLGPKISKPTPQLQLL